VRRDLAPRNVRRDLIQRLAKEFARAPEQTVMVWTPEQIATLRRLYAAGCSDQELALAIGVTVRSARGQRQRLGLMGQKSDAYDTAMRRARRERQKELAR